MKMFQYKILENKLGEKVDLITADGGFDFYPGRTR